MNDRGVRYVERPRFASVYHDVIRCQLQASNRTPHRKYAGLENVVSVDLPNRRGSDTDGESVCDDLAHQLLTLFRGELLRVIDASHRSALGGHDHRTSDNGAREGAPSNFIYSGNERPMLRAEITFDRAPAHVRRGSGLLFRRSGGRHDDARLLLADARRLASKLAQVVQLRATHATTTHHGDIANHRAVYRENALDADAVGNLADSERLTDTAAATGDTNAFERLNALLVAFLHAHVNAQRIT